MGKTHLKRLLLSEKPNLTGGYVSTGLADNPIQAYVQSSIADVDESHRWTVLDKEELWKILAKAWGIEQPEIPIVAVDPNVCSQLEHQNLPPQPACQEHKEFRAVIENGILEAGITISSSPVFADLSVVPSESKPYSNPGAKKSNRKYINAFLNTEGEKIYNVKLVHIIDSGGQPQFLELLPAFIKEVSAFLFAVNLSEPLGHRPTISFYGKDCQPVGEPTVSPYSHKQILEQCLRVAHATNKCPQVFVVGTHRDEESKCSEKIEDKNEMIKRISHETNSRHLVLKKANEVIWAINGKSPDSQDEKVATQLRQAIAAQCQVITRSLPIKWFRLESLIQKAAVKDVISFKECQQLALRLDMNEEGLKAALRHMTNYNMLLWFDEIDDFKEVIFYDPQVIFKIITDLVQFKYELTGCMVEQTFSCHGVKESWCTKFKDHAIVSEEFVLSHELLKRHFIHDAFTVKHFIKLMCHLYIMVPLENSNDFLMPILLDFKNIEANSKKTTLVEPLRILFPNESAPYGMFSRIVAFLQKAEECLLDEVNKIPKCLSRNCVTFRYKKFPATFTIIDLTAFIEVHLDFVKPLEDSCKACPRIRKLIHKGIKKCAEVLRCSGWGDVKDGFVCSNDSCRFVATPYEEQPNMAECTRCSNKYMELTSCHTVWIAEEKSGKSHASLLPLT